MNIPDIKFNKSNIENITFQGAGGKEKQIKLIFESEYVKRVNASLYDFEIEGVKIECKRQENSNWFNYAKFHNLNNEEMNIVVLFINHKKGKIDNISAILLQDFIDLACSDSLCQKDGWNFKAISKAYITKSLYPALEYKAPVHIRKLMKNYPDKFRIFYNS